MSDPTQAPPTRPSPAPDAPDEVHEVHEVHEVGMSCPATIYTAKNTVSMYVDPSTSDVRSAFRPLVVR
jgi:hypothetical protein